MSWDNQQSGARAVCGCVTAGCTGSSGGKAFGDCTIIMVFLGRLQRLRKGGIRVNWESKIWGKIEWTGCTRGLFGLNSQPTELYTSLCRQLCSMPGACSWSWLLTELHFYQFAWMRDSACIPALVCVRGLSADTGEESGHKELWMLCGFRFRELWGARGSMWLLVGITQAVPWVR